jgi:RHS repeat-associated protein
MAGISSKAAGKMENRYKFNGGTEFNNDFDISFYETQCRSYDPQLGRFLQIDELAEGAWEWTPYQFALDNPIRLNDPLGLEAEEAIADGGKKRKHKFNEEQTLQTVVVKSVRKLSHDQMVDVYWNLRNSGKGFGGVSDKLRERLDRQDGIERFMENVHRQTREQDMIALEIAANFIPVGWITKLKYVKYAANLFKLKRGIVAAKLLAKAKPLITVLGKAEWKEMGIQGYEKVAAEMGYNSFQVSDDVWKAMTYSEQLAANMKFLGEVVARGDEIIFSKWVASISGETGFFLKELEFLDKAGYHLSADGLGMIK